MTRREKVWRWTARSVALLDSLWIGAALRLLAAIYLAAWPVALDSDFVSAESWKWWGFIGFLFAGLVLWLLERFRNAGALEALKADLDRINGSFAGGLENLARLQLPYRGPLSEDQARRLCESFLARIRSYAYSALGVTETDLRLRVTLSVPVRDASGQIGLRVWAYDQPYDDRRWSWLDLRWDGGPAAFRTGAVSVITDLEDLKLPTFTGRRFRSVINFPVLHTRTGASYDCLGTVNIDAEQPHFFTVRRMEQLRPFVLPGIQAIGLVLTLRNPHVPFQFEA